MVAKRSADDTALEASGISEVEDHLVNALAGEKIHWLEDAVGNKAVDVLAHATAELELRVRALNIPLEDLAAKSDEFREALLRSRNSGGSLATCLLATIAGCARRSTLASPTCAVRLAPNLLA